MGTCWAKLIIMIKKYLTKFHKVLFWHCTAIVINGVYTSDMASAIEIYNNDLSITSIENCDIELIRFIPDCHICTYYIRHKYKSQLFELGIIYQHIKLKN
jgi:hypothetical protein